MNLITSPSVVERFLHLANRLSLGAAWFGGAITLISVLLICFDVFVRKFFGFTTGAANELSGYAFAISTSWSLAFVALHRGNVRVDALYQLFPARISAVLDWVALVALGVFMVYLTYFAFYVVETSWIQRSAANTPLATPLWIPQGLWLLGLAWMCVVLTLMLTRASVALVTGKIHVVKEICGVRSIEEEAKEEAEAGERLINEEKAT